MSDRPTPETDAETMSDGVEMLTNQSDSVALYQKLCEAVYEIEGLRRERDEARKERDQLKEALTIMENLLKPGLDLFPEIGEILKRGAAK